MVSTTHGLQLSCATEGFVLLPLQGFHEPDVVQVFVVVTISGVSNIEPDESTITLIRFFTGWAELICGTASVINSDANSDANTMHRRCESFPMAPD